MALKSIQFQLAPEGEPISDVELAGVSQSVARMGAGLILIFGHAQFFQDAHEANASGRASVLKAVLERLAHDAPLARVVGCSTAGEILDDEVLEGTLTLTAVALEHARIWVGTTTLDHMEHSHAAGLAASLQLREHCGQDLRQVWVLAPGVSINGSALVHGLKEGFNGADLPDISGGLAGDGGAFIRTWTLGPKGITTQEVVTIGFMGDQRLASGSHAQGGWEAFGPARRVTRAQGNVLFEMDREPALAVYRRYLGEYARDLPASGLLFPLQITQGPDQGLIRTILGIDEARGSLILAGDVSSDSHVRLMHASPHHLVAAAEQAAHKLLPGLPDDCHAVALLVSCVGRRIVMGDQVEEEVEAVAETLPSDTCITGFYSNGEIAAWNFTGDCRLHNQTMTISWLAEQDRVAAT